MHADSCAQSKTMKVFDENDSMCACAAPRSLACNYNTAKKNAFFRFEHILGCGKSFFRLIRKTIDA